MPQAVSEAMLFPFIDQAMWLVAFALLIALPMMMSRPTRPNAMARLRRRRERNAGDAMGVGSLGA